MKMRFAASVTLGLGLLLGGCPEPGGKNPPARALSAQIGPAGGTLEDPRGGFRLEIPEGALEETIEISATPADLDDPDLIPGTVWKFSPSGLRFDAPVALTLAWPEAASEDGDDLSIVKPLEDGSDLLIADPIVAVDPDARTLTAEIEGFSRRGVVQDPCPECSVILLSGDYNNDRMVDLRWSTVFDFSSYIIERAVTRPDLSDPANPIPARLQVFPSDWSRRTTLLSVKTYSEFTSYDASVFFYRVRSRSGRLIRPPSNVVRFIIFGETPVPGAPENFNAQLANNDPLAAHLTWTPPEVVTSYELERAVAGEPFSRIAVLPSTDFFHTDHGLIEDTEYLYRLRAQDEDGLWTPWTPTQSVQTPELCVIEVSQNGQTLDPDVDVAAPGQTIFLEASLGCDEPAGSTLHWFMGTRADPLPIGRGTSVEVDLPQAGTIPFWLEVRLGETVVVSEDEIQLTIGQPPIPSTMEVWPSFSPRIWDDGRATVIALVDPSGPISERVDDFDRIEWTVWSDDGGPRQEVMRKTQSDSMFTWRRGDLPVGRYEIEARVYSRDSRLLAYPAPGNVRIRR